MEEAYLRTEKMAVGYDGNALIKNICLTIKRGEIVVLIGPNGSGKSTILKSITRQLRMVGGKAILNGRNLSELPYRELSGEMAVVLTERIRPELMTCKDVTAMGRYPYTGRLGFLTDEDERIVKEAMESVHIEDIAGRDFMTVSDGQRQRVMLARAICQEPEIIVLDEPTSFLDIRHKMELLDILRKMAKEKGITVLVSLHEIDLAQKFADRVICVKGEEIAGYGTPEEIFTEQTIRKLYEMQEGYYDPLLGSLELKKPEGSPLVLVLSSGGTGIPVYRKLQRENIPFVAGILYRNDLDYRVARYMASEVIEEAPFEEIGEEAYLAVLRAVDACRYVLNAGVEIGKSNRRMKEILEYAEKAEKLVIPGAQILDVPCQKQ